MNKKAKEPFLAVRTVNVLIGFVILLLILLFLYQGSENESLELLIFALGAVQNFVAATVLFSEGKRIRGNICAAICAVLFVAVILLLISFLGIL